MSISETDLLNIWTGFSTSILAAATTACGFKVITSKTTSEMIFYSTIGLGTSSLCGTCLHTWLDDTSKDTDSYLNNFRKYLKIDAVNTIQLIAQETGSFIIKGLGEAIKIAIQDRLLTYRK